MILDEIHSQQGLVVLLLAFFAALWITEDSRVQDMRILLMTATKEGPVVRAVEKVLRDANIAAGRVKVPCLPGHEESLVTDLHDVTDLPRD